MPYVCKLSFPDLIGESSIFIPKAFETKYPLSPLPRGEGMKGRVSKIIITKHPHPNPPPSSGREIFGKPAAEHQAIL